MLYADEVMAKARGERMARARGALLIHPLVLGGGRRLFDGGPPTQLRLTDSVATTTGVIIADYETA